MPIVAQELKVRFIQIKIVREGLSHQLRLVIEFHGRYQESKGII